MKAESIAHAHQGNIRGAPEIRQHLSDNLVQL